MPTNPNNPSWLEPPPKSGGMGCVGKGCLTLGLIGGLVILLLFALSFLFVSHGRQPVVLPVKDLSPEALTEVQNRVDQFRSGLPAFTPTPVRSASPEES